jgi:hypothetical protein
MRSVFRLLAVHDRRETSKNRNGDADAACGFFLGLRLMRCSILARHLRRISRWHKGL